MKTAERNSRQSAAQKEWQHAVTSEDEYKYIVVRSIETFIAAVEDYLKW